MAKTKVEAELDQPDEQLDRAIEELRGVLHEEEKRPDAGVQGRFRRQFQRHHEHPRRRADHPRQHRDAGVRADGAAEGLDGGAQPPHRRTGRRRGQRPQDRARRDHRAGERSVALRHQADRDHRQRRRPPRNGQGGAHRSGGGGRHDDADDPDAPAEGRRHTGGDGQAVGQPAAEILQAGGTEGADRGGAPAAHHSAERSRAHRRRVRGRVHRRRRPARFRRHGWTPSSTNRSRPKR